MDVQDAFYHGVRQHIRNVLGRMTADEIDGGLTAFEDGESNWSSCFFARAFPAMQSRTGSPEWWLVEHLGFSGVTPIRVVWHTFDSLNHYMTREQMREFIESVRDESRPDEVMQLLRGLAFTPDMENVPCLTFC